MLRNYDDLTKLASQDVSALKRELERRFTELYGAASQPIQFFAAPARINIIGEHIDYNGGMVLPTAIDRYIYLAIRRRDDATINYDDIRFPGRFTFDITENFSYKKESDYCNYLNGVITIMKDRGVAFPTGFDALFFSCIPDGGGVSSSSALECCFIAAMSQLYGGNISPVDNALIGQETEHRFMNVQCGIMDQFIIATGRKDSAVLLNCATLDYQYIPLELGDYRFIVMNSNKKRQLADSKYNQRVAECKEGLEILNTALAAQGKKPVANPCSMTMDDLALLQEALKTNAPQTATAEIIYRRMRHCITENQRVHQATEALKSGNLKQLGQLMNASHQSLKDDYETTGIELDTLNQEANKVAGCLGARVTGAGFGGCAIALVHKEAIPQFIETVGAAYQNAIGYEATFFECATGNGAGPLN